MVKLLFMAVMYASEGLFGSAGAMLEQKYGSLKAESHPYDFGFTRYYEEEMGPNLKKKFLVFEKEISKKDLAEIKLFITEIEEKLAVNKKRKVNIDPGYLSEKELVLATWKAKDFKEQISDKVWVHKVLEFNGSEVKGFFHTFADYKIKENQDFLIKEKP